MIGVLLFVILAPLAYTLVAILSPAWAPYAVLVTFLILAMAGAADWDY